MWRFTDRSAVLTCCLALLLPAGVETAAASRPGRVGDSIVRYFAVKGTDTLWMAGEDGLYRSTNGGSSWTCLNAGLSKAGFDTEDPSRFDVFDAVFRDDGHGWLLSIDGQVYATRDAGATWRRQPLSWSAGEPREGPLGLVRIQLRWERQPWLLGASKTAAGGNLERPFLCRSSEDGTTWACRDLPEGMRGPFSLTIAADGVFWLLASEASQLGLYRGDPESWNWEAVTRVPTRYAYRLHWERDGGAYLFPFLGSFADPAWRLDGADLTPLELPSSRLPGKLGVDGRGRPWLWLLDEQRHEESALLVGQPAPSAPQWKLARHVRFDGFRPLGVRFAFRDDEVWVLLSGSEDYRSSRHALLYSPDGNQWKLRFGPGRLRVCE